MRDAKVIEFPKAQSTRKRMQNRMQEQKSILMLSIASVLVMTVFLNQWLVQSPASSLTNDGNRNVASFEPATFAKDLKWEHHLAKELSNSEVTGQLAEAPTLRDELIFGFLEGKYGMKLEAGHIQSLEFIDAQAGDQPLQIADKVEFLSKFAEAFGIKYTEVSAKADNYGSYNLIDSNKRIVATAHFVTDDEGRVTAINIQE